MPILDNRAGVPGWKTVRLIGQGSFGSVYEIERDVFGDVERCALKHISIPHSENEIYEMKSEGQDQESITQSFSAQAKDIVSEYKLLMRLNNCPYVVHCHDVSYVQKDNAFGWDIYIRMELLEPLTKRLSEDLQWTEAQIVRVGSDITKALVACENEHILHRDIKPQNIFVSQDGLYKLGDFGIARIAEKTSAATARIGTYTYMAPEVYHGDPYGSSADIYSLGMVLYWLLNDRRAPYVSENTMREKERALTRRMNGEALPAPRNGSEALKRIVMKACSYDPKDRYQSAEEMLRDLEALNGPAATTVPVLEPVGAAVSRAPASQDTDDDGTVGMFGKPALAPAKATAPGSPSVPDEEGTIGVFKTTAPANTERPPVPDEDGTLGVFKKSDSVPAAVADSHTLAEQKPKKEESKAERSGPDKKSEPEKTSKPGHSSEPVPPAPPKKKTGLIVGVLGALAAAVILLLVLLPKGGQSASTLPASQPTTEAQQTAQATAKPAAKPTAEPTAISDGKTIRLVNGRIEVDAMLKKLAQMYENKTGVKVEIESMGGGIDIQGTLRGYYQIKNMPDIFVNGGAADFANWEGLLADLSGEAWVSDTDAAYVTDNGAVVGFPCTVEAIGLAYNKDILAKAGIDAASLTSPAAYEAAFATLEAKKNELGLVAVVGYYTEPANMYWSSGNHIFGQYEDAGLARDDTTYYDMLADGGKLDVARFTDFAKFIALLQEHADQSMMISGTYDQQVLGFSSGNYAFVTQGNWIGVTMTSKNKEAYEAAGSFQAGFAPYAFQAGIDTILTSAPYWWAVYKDGNVEEAKAFLQWLTSDEAQEVLVHEAGFISPFKSCKYVANDPFAQSVSEYIASGKTSEWHWRANKEGLAQNYLGQVFYEYAKGELSLDQFVSACQQACQNCYAS